MQDVVRGVERARAWPRPKGSNQTPAQLEQQEWFRQANWAFKYADMRIQAACRRATHRTSLYPRDLFTMMAKGKVMTLLDENNFRIWPLAYVLDVSESLDAISQIPGTILIREADRWRGIPLPVNPPALPWTEVLDQVIAAPTAELIADVTGYEEWMVQGNDITASASGSRALQLSTDGGATWWNAAGNYRTVNVAGVSFAQSMIFLHGTNSSAARTGWVTMTNAQANDCWKNMDRPNVGDGAMYQFVGSNDAITHIRIFTTVGNMTGGRVRVIAR